MQVKKDGHIGLYSLDDWKRLCGNHGFRCIRSFDSTIRFPRKYEEVYREIIARTDKEIVDGYDIQIVGDEIYVTEQVNNILFGKQE